MRRNVCAKLHDIWNKFKHMPATKQITLSMILFGLLYIVLCIVPLWLSNEDNSSYFDLVSGIMVPVYLAVLAGLLSQSHVSDTMALNVKLYSRNQIKIPDNTISGNLLKVFSPKGFEPNQDITLIEVENSGVAAISYMHIFINKKDPKKDRPYYLHCTVSPKLQSMWRSICLLVKSMT